MTIAKMIDHTLLKPEASEKDIVRLCHEAKQYQFASVCVPPVYVYMAAKMLYGTGVKVGTVIGFPLGANDTEIKVYEVYLAKAHGANEVDMVMNIGWAKSGRWDAVTRDVGRVAEAAHGSGLLLKVIVETALLTEEEKKKAAALVVESGAEYIKTSTGFAKGGATVEDVRNFKLWVGDKIKIKASGGIRTRELALALIDAGAERLGTSAGIQLLGP
ncbi:MAG: deoxyribose-phosphate aldolase [Peptococcaceae bacterium]|jgi:deoxyribose-phosphate aldolase|nr:deoxyribose-phosphate aldolase [Peptococcaceae bacterium]